MTTDRPSKTIAASRRIARWQARVAIRRLLPPYPGLPYTKARLHAGVAAGLVRAGVAVLPLAQASCDIVFGAQLLPQLPGALIALAKLWGSFGPSAIRGPLALTGLSGQDTMTTPAAPARKPRHEYP